MSDSTITKRAIADSLKDLTRTKSFDKIGVIDITEKCGINRQTFYYHFDDIPSLMEEIFNDQADEFVSHTFSPDNLYDSIMEAITFSLENKTAILHVFNSPNRQFYDRYLNRVARRTVTEFFDNFTKDSKRISAEDREAVVMYYKSLLIGFVFDWVSDGAQYDLSLKVKRICEIFEGTIELALERCSE